MIGHIAWHKLIKLLKNLKTIWLKKTYSKQFKALILISKLVPLGHTKAQAYTGMKLLHRLSFVLLHTTNDNEMKKNECNFVKMKFHLNKKYVEWIFIMQVESNATQLNLKLIKISKIESSTIFILNSTKLMFPLKFNWIEFSWIETYWIQLKTHWLNLFKLVWIQPNYENSITKKIC